VTATLEQPPPTRVRVRARPDPIERAAPAADHAGHAPWAVALAATVAGGVWVEPATLGLLACGAGALAVLAALAHGRVRVACQALHLSGGLFVLAAVQGPAAAGALAPAAGVLLTGLLFARTSAERSRRAVAALSGIAPWHFRRHYRRQTMRFGLAGIATSVLLALAGPTLLVRIAAVALLPLSMRAYVGNMISARRARTVWLFVTPLHLALLGALVPEFGPAAAAWCLAGAEAALLCSAALFVTRRTGVTPFQQSQVAILVATAALVGTVTFPSTREWPFLVAVLGGVALGAVLFPRAAPESG